MNQTNITPRQKDNQHHTRQQTKQHRIETTKSRNKNIVLYENYLFSLKEKRKR